MPLFAVIFSAIIQTQAEEQFRDPCTRVMVFLIAKDLAEGIPQAGEVLLGSRHTLGLAPMLLSGCYHHLGGH